MSISLIRDRVQVTILRDTSAVERVNFGVPLFIGESAPLAATRAQSFASIDEVDAVFAPTDPEFLAAQAFFSQTPQPRKLIIGYKAALETYPEALALIFDINDEWFAVAIESVLEADALLMAPAVSAMQGFRQFWARSADPGILDPLDTTDLASQLKVSNFDQSRVVYHSQAATLYPEMAQMGRVLPIVETRTSGPGSIAWFDQTVAGIPGDAFTATQRSTLEAKNAEYFVSIAQATRAQGGKMAGGEWGDVMHGIAWLDARLAEDVFETMTRAADRLQKIAFTDTGISQIEAAVRNRLILAVDLDFITPDFTLTVPRREDTQFGDRANRILKDVRFEAPLAGAIKFVNITGIVSA